jgi:hypothetical protein
MKSSAGSRVRGFAGSRVRGFARPDARRAKLEREYQGFSSSTQYLVPEYLYLVRLIQRAL